MPFQFCTQRSMRAKRSRICSLGSAFLRTSQRHSLQRLRSCTMSLADHWRQNKATRLLTAGRCCSRDWFPAATKPCSRPQISIYVAANSPDPGSEGPFLIEMARSFARNRCRAALSGWIAPSPLTNFTAAIRRAGYKKALNLQGKRHAAASFHQHGLTK